MQLIPARLKLMPSISFNLRKRDEKNNACQYFSGHWFKPARAENFLNFNYNAGYEFESKFQVF